MTDVTNNPSMKRRGCVSRLARVGVVLGGLSVVAGLVAAGIAGVLYQNHVVNNPGSHLERGHIYSIIAQDSPVYYRDGKTRVGVFFEDEHREYVGWDELPLSYTFAIVAAEDAGYWRHAGVSPLGITRAMVANLMAGRMVAGGSTLTQQTAKNLYYRPDRSLKSKWTELVNALRLEAHYSKRDILTFYANQFHVSGNGRGLGIAARYFFDHNVSELTTLEQAFLAGLVKAPSYYDPFLGDEARRQKSTERAHDRTRYVLRRLTEVPIQDLVGPRPSDGDVAAIADYERRVIAAAKTKKEAERLLAEGFVLPFKRGTFRYDSSAVLDEVARRLQEPPFDTVLSDAGIEDPASAGLVVITTLDPDAQREAIYGLWHHLSELGPILEGLTVEDWIKADSRGPRFDPDLEMVPHSFHVARVLKIVDPSGKPTLEVDLGGTSCLVDRDAVVRASVAAWRGHKKDRYAKVPTGAVNDFISHFTAGTVVWVSVRSVPDKGPPLCDLEVRPELQGAVIALENGEIRAMVGGNDNRNFNRSTALRQMGSTWKPILYHAALKLGWTPLSELDNRRNVFPFSTTFYYPRPDHEPPDVVSMSWAGVRSENLATVWLLYHLLDDLNGEQIRTIAERFDLARREGESEQDYRVRIQKAGVLPTAGRVEEVLFLQARQEVLQGLALDGHPEDEVALRSLLYGWGFEAEKRRVAREGPRTRAWKERALANSFQHIQPMLEPCEHQYHTLKRAVSAHTVPEPRQVELLSYRTTEQGVELACGTTPEDFRSIGPELLSGEVTSATTQEASPASTDGITRVGAASVPSTSPAHHPDPEQQSRPERPTTIGKVISGLFGGESKPLQRLFEPKVELPDLGAVRVDDRLHFRTVRALEKSMERRRLARQAAGSSAPGLYDPELLYWHQDFRVLLSLKYLRGLAVEYGVQTDIGEVLSMPLGASEITLEEAVAVYDGIVSGETWDFPGTAATTGSLLGTTSVGQPIAPALLIAEIRDVDGNLIYRATPERREVAPPEVGAMTSDILRNTVRYGTGRRAADPIRSGGKPVPVGGKTGTTNDFRNAAFLGYAPHVQRGGYEAASGWSVGVYVGYDDNRPMSRGNLRVGGSSGALPAWISTVDGIVQAGLLGEPDPGWTDVAGAWPLVTPRGLERIPVDPAGGGLAIGTEASDDPSAASVLSAPPAVSRAPQVSLADARAHRPVRTAPRTEDILRVLQERRRRRAEEAKQRESVWNAP